MAQKIKKNASQKLAAVLDSQRIYCDLALRAYNADLIDLTEKQVNQLNLMKKNGFVSLPDEKNPVFVLTDSAKTTAKISMITPNLARTPLKQSNEASKKAMEAMRAFDIMKGLLLKKNGKKKIYAEFLTLTFANARLGELEKAMWDLKSGYLKLKDMLRKNKEFEEFRPLGGLPSFEITVNKESLSRQNAQNLFHPHIHVLLYFDKEIDIDALKLKIFKKWADFCAKTGHKMDFDAQLLEHAYSEESGKKVQNNASLASIREAVKYSVKPDDINRLALTGSSSGADDDFKLRVFAEIYNVFVSFKRDENGNVERDKNDRIKKRKFRVDSFGMMKEAIMYYHSLVKAGLSGIFLQKTRDSEGAGIPTIFTNISKFSVTGSILSKYSKSGHSYSAHFSDTETLNQAETLYYNSSIAQKTIFEDFDLKSLKSAVKKLGKLGKKADTLMWLLEHWFSINKNVEDVNEVFEDWYKASYDTSQKKDIALLTNAYNWAYNCTDAYQMQKVRNFSEYDYARYMKKVAENIGLSESDVVAMSNGKFTVTARKYIDSYVFMKTGKHVTDSNKTGITDWSYWQGSFLMGAKTEITKLVAYYDDNEDGSKAERKGKMIGENVGFLNVGSENRHINLVMSNSMERILKLLIKWTFGEDVLKVA